MISKEFSYILAAIFVVAGVACILRAHKIKAFYDSEFLGPKFNPFGEAVVIPSIIASGFCFILMAAMIFLHNLGIV